jgi:hypothetical protein
MSKNQGTPTPTDRLRAYGEMVRQMAKDLESINNGMPMLEGQDTIHGHQVVQAVKEFHLKHQEVTRQKIEALITFGDRMTSLADASNEK